jgi:hypothetical protein
MTATGLVPLGIFHTLVGVVALVSAAIALVRRKEISPSDRAGQVYLAATLVTAATAFGIFRHGGFTPGHGLAIMTIVAIAIGALAKATTIFGGAAHMVQAIAFTSTLLFHAIPTVTEGLTRLPPGAPVYASGEDPAFQKIYGVILVLFIVGLTMQIRWLRSSRATTAPQP